MNKGIRVGITLLLSVLLLGGCWDRREVEELLIIDALAFDLIMKENGQYYQITFVTAKPAGGGGDQQMGMNTSRGGGTGADWIASSQGSTLEQAMLNFTTRAPRYLHMDHSTLVLIGEDMARAGVSELLDFLVRNRDIRLRKLIMVTRGDALDLMSAVPEFEATLARELQVAIDRGGKQGDFFQQINLNIFTQSVLTPGQDPWAPIVHTFQPTETEEVLTEKAIRIEGTALFRSDKLVGFLSPQETQGFVILQGLASRGSYIVSYKEGPVSFVYQEAKTSRKLVRRDDKLEVDFEVTLQGVIAEIHVATRFRDQDIKELETLITRTAQKEILNTIAKCQQLGVDVFGIGREIHVQQPNLWKGSRDNWEEIYKDMKINLTVTVEITGTTLGFKSITPNGE